ncbi:hypothetical protein AHAS_Ahas15G0253900 [Arachis hypogaea]
MGKSAQAKFDEIEAIGFGFLKLVPKWHVKQGIMTMLAKAYDIETSTLKLDNGNICIGPEIFQRVFRIPPGDDRMEFRKHFILLVLKMFLCLAMQHVISLWHIDTVLDVLYFQNLKHGELENCQEHEPWLSARTAEKLSVMAETVQLEDCSKPGGNDGGVMEGAARKDKMDESQEREDADHTIRPVGCTKVRFIEDTAQVAMPTYKLTQKGLPFTYAFIPIQPNSPLFPLA